MKFTPNYKIVNFDLVEAGWEIVNNVWVSKTIYDGFRFNYTIYYSSFNKDCYAIAHKLSEKEYELSEAIEEFEWLQRNRDSNNVEGLKILLKEIGTIREEDIK